MSSITIAQRLHPFSHTPGTSCLVPGTPYRLRAFPTRLCVEDLSGPYPKSIKVINLDLTGPTKDFTIQQDLEKGIAKVWGHYKEGFVRFFVRADAEGKGLILMVDKSPREGVRSETYGVSFMQKQQYNLLTGNIRSSADRVFTPCETERLSLGCHKAQDWDLVVRRESLSELLPFWLRLGSMTPKTEFHGNEGTLQLFEECEKAIAQRDKLGVCPAFLNLFKAGFSEIFIPRIADDDHQGLGVTPPSEHFQGSPLYLLNHGVKLIRRLFLEEQEGEIAVLPTLPPEFHCGRLVNAPCGMTGECDLEWTKKTIRRAIIRSKSRQTIRLKFQKGLKSYRLRTDPKEKGIRKEVTGSLEIEEGRTYYFDNFQK